MARPDDAPRSPLDIRRFAARVRAESVAQSWRRGHRNVTRLADAYGVTRDTVYSDLRGQGVDPADRDAPVEETPVEEPPGCPLCGAAVAEDGLHDHVSGHGHDALVSWIVERVS
ncbi:hypothetical protein [Nocardiopsis sp. M1B1]|uniref:hypothetical protein n=1 Tax=Nocardiopsis sp. M1B1 TaxID=3450454 RepID=UPI004039E2E9